MKRATKIVITLGTALSLGLAAAAVSAHPHGYGMDLGMMGGYGPGNGMGPGMMGGYGPRYGMHGWGNTDESLAALKSELGITDKQDSAWQAFAKNAKQQQENRLAWFAKMQEARSAGSAPERLAQQTEFIKQRQVEMEANAAALKNLYAALTPEQKAIADQRFGDVRPGYGAGYGRGARGSSR
jgi:Spy/CpxP family protein refolding chaperone